MLRKIRRNYRRLIAFVLSMTMIISNMGANAGTVFAAEKKEELEIALFMLDGQEILDAVRNLESQEEFVLEDLELEAAKKSVQKTYEELLAPKKGKVYELALTVDDEMAPNDTELLTLYRTETKEVVFLFVNESNEALDFCVNIDGYETKLMTVNPNSAKVKDDEKAAGEAEKKAEIKEENKGKSEKNDREQVENKADESGKEEGKTGNIEDESVSGKETLTDSDKEDKKNSENKDSAEIKEEKNNDSKEISGNNSDEDKTSESDNTKNRKDGNTASDKVTENNTETKNEAEKNEVKNSEEKKTETEKSNSVPSDGAKSDGEKTSEVKDSHAASERKDSEKAENSASENKDSAKSDSNKAENSKSENSKSESNTSENSKTESSKTENSKSENNQSDSKASEKSDSKDSGSKEISMSCHQAAFVAVPLEDIQNDDEDSAEAELQEEVKEIVSEKEEETAEPEKSEKNEKQETAAPETEAKNTELSNQESEESVSGNGSEHSETAERETAAEVKPETSTEETSDAETNEETKAEETKEEETNKETAETKVNEEAAETETDEKKIETEATTNAVENTTETEEKEPAVSDKEDKEILDDEWEIPGKAYDGVTIRQTARARAYCVDLEDVRKIMEFNGEELIDAVDAFHVDYQVNPENAANITGADTVNSGESLYFAVEPEEGYEIVAVYVNGNILEAIEDVTSLNNASTWKGYAYVYRVEEVSENLGIEIEMAELETIIAAAVYIAKTADAIFTVDVPDGAFEEEVELRVTKIEGKAELQELVEQANNALEEGQSIAEAEAYDIAFISLESGEEIEPLKPVAVDMSFKKAIVSDKDEEAANEIVVIHLPDDAEAKTVASAEDVDTTEFSFQADSFSLYLRALVSPDNASLNGKNYATISAALKVAGEGDTITLLKDIAESVTVSQNVTFDLNGHTWMGRDIGTTLTVDLSNSKQSRQITVTVKNGNMSSAEGYRSIETKLQSSLTAQSDHANVIVSGVVFTASGSVDKEDKIALDGSNSQLYGGIIYVENGDLTAEGCTFTGASGVYEGSHIAITPRNANVYPKVNLTISGCTFSGADKEAVCAVVENKMTGRGVTVNVSESVFEKGAKGLRCKVGNALSKPELDINVNDSTFTKNTSSSISVEGNNSPNVNVQLKGTTIKDNEVNVNSNVLKIATYGDITIEDGEISGNTITTSTGYSIVDISNGSLTIKETTISNNKGYKAVTVNSPSKTVSITKSTFENNTNTSSDLACGTLGVSSANAIIIDDSKFMGNTTEKGGGALCINGTGIAVNIDKSEFINNTAGLYGGAIYLSNTGTTTITNTVINGNTANSTSTIGGGGIYVTNTSGTVTLGERTRIYNNQAPEATVKHQTTAATADIVLQSGSSSSQYASENNVKRAELKLNCETSFNIDDGTVYTLTKSDAKGLKYDTTSSTGKKTYYWPIGYYTVTVEPTRVYLSASGSHTGSKDINGKTLAEAVKAVEETGINKIYVCGNTTVDMANAASLNSGIVFVRCKDHPNSHMFTINGDVTLDNAHIDGQNIESDTSMIYVPSSGHLTITDDTVIENGRNTGNGGAIYVSQGSLTMNGGTITKNTAKQGGGIYAMGGKLVTFKGGTVSKNIATGGNGGGGAYIEATSSEFGVHGGRTLFDGNEANQLGGGVFLVNGTNANTHHYIYKATFTNNKSYRSGYYFDGGAIYVQSGTTAHMKNVYVSGNSDSDKANNGYTAVAVCPTGELAIYELEGLLAVNNGENPDIGVIAGGQMTSVEPMVYLPSNAPGGGEVAYRYSNGTKVDTSDYQFIKGYFRLYTEASGSAIKAAKETAEADGVVITSNYATQFGSGIMTNGILKIGTETKSLKVVKEWADGEENHDNDQILVYLTKDGEIVDKDFRSDSSVILNKENNWNYTWTNLGEQFKWGVKEASVHGYTSKVEVKKDTEFAAIADKYYIATIKNIPGEPSNKLVITKTAYGLDPDASYKFTLKLGDVGEKVFALQLDGTLYPIYDNENIEFYLKSGQSAVVDGLPDGFTYTVEEEKGEYLTDTFDMVTTNLDGAGNIYSVNVVNNSRVDITGEKEWDDADNQDGKRPSSITVKLYANGESVDSKTVTADDGWKWKFENLRKYDAQGELIEYTFVEVGIPGYTTKVVDPNKDNDYRGKIVNSHTPERVTISGRKVWDDANNQDGKRPDSITIKLYANNEEVRSQTITAENNWRWSFDGLDKYYNGKLITYTFGEAGAGDLGYTRTELVNPAEDNAYEGKIVNSYTPDEVDRFVIKKWDDHENQDRFRPEEIVVQLLANGKETEKLLTLNEKNHWQGGWKHLPKYNEGKEIVYTVKEISKTSEYLSSTEYNEGTRIFTITNTHTPKVRTLQAIKKWEDGNNQDGIRPEDGVEVQLMANGVPEGDVVRLNEGNQWRCEWKDLPVYQSGETIVYTVEEISKSDKYTTSIGYEEETEQFIITNTHVPEVKTLKAVKVWEDQNNQAGLRTADIEVQLMANGVPEGTAFVLNEANQWSCEWKDLPVYQNGKMIVYSVVENTKVAQYSTAYTYDEGTNTFTITNHYTPEIPEQPTEPNTPDTPDNPPGGNPPNRPSRPSRDIPNTPTPQTSIPEEPTPRASIPDEPTPVDTIIEDEIPMAGLPNEPVEMVIIDDDVPLFGLPKTGDNRHMGLWMALFGLSGMGILLTMAGRKKSKDDE